MGRRVEVGRRVKVREGGEESEERREEGGGGEKDRTYWPWREVRKVRREEKREKEGRRTEHIGHGGR